MTRTLFVDTDAPTDADAATAFLESFDYQLSVRRSALSRLYIKAGRPGGLTFEQLHELAAERWPQRASGRPAYVPFSTRR